MRECLLHLQEIRGVVLRDVGHLPRDGGVRCDAAIDALLVGEVQALLIIAQRVPLVLGVLNHEVHRDGGILGPRGVELVHYRLDIARRPFRITPRDVRGRVGGVVAAGGVDGTRGNREGERERDEQPLGRAQKVVADAFPAHATFDSTSVPREKVAERHAVAGGRSSAAERGEGRGRGGGVIIRVDAAF